MNESIIEAIFHKPIHNLQEEDLVDFFRNEQRETDIIEFKSYMDFPQPGTTKASRDKEKLSDIKRTICAFLNSNGGTLIWGAPKGVSVAGGKENIFQGELTGVEIRIEPDQFINMIAAEISPTPLRVLFQPIEISVNRFCYVFEVNRSEFAPHQLKGTYYMRLDGSTRPAPHHYVEALIKKISYPKLEIYLSFGEALEMANVTVIPTVLTIHNLSKFINDRAVSFRVVAVDCDFIDPYQQISSSLKWGTDFSKEAKDILHYNMPFYENYLLVVPRSSTWNSGQAVEVGATLWGKLSPVVASKYKLVITNTNPGVRVEIERQENFYLHEETSKLNDIERLQQSRDELLKIYQRQFLENSFNKLYNITF